MASHTYVRDNKLAMPMPRQTDQRQVTKRKRIRTSSNLTPLQLARKRAKDREAQRVVRARTKEYIARLEQEIAELKTKNDQYENPLVQDLRHINRQLENELAHLRASLEIPVATPSTFPFGLAGNTVHLESIQHYGTTTPLIFERDCSAGILDGGMPDSSSRCFPAESHWHAFPPPSSETWETVDAKSGLSTLTYLAPHCHEPTYPPGHEPGENYRPPQTSLGGR